MNLVNLDRKIENTIYGDIEAFKTDNIEKYLNKIIYLTRVSPFNKKIIGDVIKVKITHIDENYIISGKVIFSHKILNEERMVINNSSIQIPKKFRYGDIYPIKSYYRYRNRFVSGEPEYWYIITKTNNDNSEIKKLKKMRF